MSFRPSAVALAGVLALAGAMPASAHHSFNMFALDKVQTVSGTVKKFDWKMPHVWLYVTIPTANGAEDWAFEAHSPNLAARKGWKSSTVKPGDKISVAMHPMKDGSKAGSVIYVTFPDGKVLWNADSVNAP